MAPHSASPLPWPWATPCPEDGPPARGELPLGQGGEDSGRTASSGASLRPHRPLGPRLVCFGPATAGKDSGENKALGLNGHCLEQSSKAFMFGDQLIIQTPRFEKEDV